MTQRLQQRVEALQQKASRESHGLWKLLSDLHQIRSQHRNLSLTSLAVRVTSFL